jgi:hypothetical protein
MQSETSYIQKVRPASRFCRWTPLRLRVAYLRPWPMIVTGLRRAQGARQHPLQVGPRRRRQEDVELPLRILMLGDFSGARRTIAASTSVSRSTSTRRTSPTSWQAQNLSAEIRSQPPRPDKDGEMTMSVSSLHPSTRLGDFRPEGIVEPTSSELRELQGAARRPQAPQGPPRQRPQLHPPHPGPPQGSRQARAPDGGARHRRGRPAESRFSRHLAHHSTEPSALKVHRPFYGRTQRTTQTTRAPKGHLTCLHRRAPWRRPSSIPPATPAVRGLGQPAHRTAPAPKSEARQPTRRHRAHRQAPDRRHRSSRLTAQVNAILHAPEVKALETAWRGVKYLVDEVDFRENVRLEMVNGDQGRPPRRLPRRPRDHPHRPLPHLL